MKTILLLPVTVLFAFSALELMKSSSLNDETEIKWLSLEEAQAQAGEDGKPLLVFVEAEWCGTCKQMMNTVFPDTDISKLVAENYHPVVIDLDSKKKVLFNGKQKTERNFSRTMQVQQTPTMIFIDSSGEVMGRQPGFMDRSELKKLLHYVLSDQFGEVPVSEFQID